MLTKFLLVILWFCCALGLWAQDTGADRSDPIPSPTQSLLTTNYIARTSSGCLTVSIRNKIRQDSIVLLPVESSLTRDGHILVAGTTMDFNTPSMVRNPGFCMKTDQKGNVVWFKMYDSLTYKGYHEINYQYAKELSDGNILLAGRSTNYITRNRDVIFTKTDQNGNIIWVRTYQSRDWKGFNGSGDSFDMNEIQEDPVTKDIYFSGTLWFSYSTLTKVNPVNGDIVWSRGYNHSEYTKSFGFVINNDHILSFHLIGDLSSYIGILTINKSTGEPTAKRYFEKTDAPLWMKLIIPQRVRKLDNGHYLLAGKHTQNIEIPAYTGTVDLYHMGLVEFDAQLNFVRSWGFKSKIESNAGEPRLSIFPDGSGVFSMMRYNANIELDNFIVMFNGDKINRQIRRDHVNDLISFDPAYLQLPDNSYLNIKFFGQKGVSGINGSEIEFYRVHPADTSYLCFGMPDSSTSTFSMNYKDFGNLFDSAKVNCFVYSQPQTLHSWDATARTLSFCTTVSTCNDISITASDSAVCVGSTTTITLKKDPGCASEVSLFYDESWTGPGTKLNDSTYQFQLSKAGTGFFKAGIVGCPQGVDSVSVKVTAAKSSFSLGKDTALCQGNSIVLNTGGGFSTYRWQDGSTDSSLRVNMPGLYHVEVANACGDRYRDTLQVLAAPPVNINLGADRIICFGDTVQLTAPSGFIRYQWESLSLATPQNTRTINTQPASNAIYFLRAEKTPGCFGYDTIGVSVNPLPSVYLGADTSFCAGDSVLFTAPAGFLAYTWSNGTKQESLVAKTPGTYWVQVENSNGCRSRDTVAIQSVYALPIVNLDPASEICFGEKLTYDAGQQASYAWNTGETGRYITVSAPGTYTVTVKNTRGCTASDTAVIKNLRPLPSKFLYADTAICAFEEILIKPLGSFNGYRWSTGATTSTIMIKQPGQYWLEVTDQAGCKGKDTILVAPKECVEGFYIPNAFTPNADGKNDGFGPIIFGVVEKYSISVFNRFGEMVFTSRDPKQKWDGNFKGTAQNPGVFTWSCTFQLKGQPMRAEKGTVVLIR